MKTKKKYQNYAKGKKNSNTNWELKNDEGVSTTSFSEYSIMGVSHFKNLFKAPPKATIAKVIHEVTKNLI